jgi:hypothetical protein
MKATVKTTWEAPKFAKVESFVRDLALRLDLDVWTQTEKGWFSERGRLKVSGDHEACQKFIDIFKDAISRFNS